MMQSTLLEFRSSVFAVAAGEDRDTNPGIFGKNLAKWMAEQLRARGVPAGEVIAEDFGWCIPVESKSHNLYVACASARDQRNQWRVFAFAEGGLILRLIGKDQRKQSIASLFATLKDILQSASHIQDLREETQ